MKDDLFAPLVTQEFWHGDCLELMQNIPDSSVDMVLCDPPYGTVKGIGSANVDHGMVGKTEWDDVIDIDKMFNEYNRVLRTNGACVVFSQEPYTTEIINKAHNNVPFSYRMIWKKDHFANALVAKKAPVSYYEDVVVFFKNYDTTKSHPLSYYGDEVLRYIDKPRKEIFKEMGTQGACHFLRGTTSIQFSIPTENIYNKLIEMYRINNMKGFIQYSEMKTLDNMQKERLARVFNLPEGQKYMSNVLEFKKDYGGLHPTQKPVALFEYLIKTYTHPGETVLDNCAGSGTTAIAALNTGRGYICIERDDEYYRRATERVRLHGQA